MKLIRVKLPFLPIDTNRNELFSLQVLSAARWLQASLPGRLQVVVLPLLGSQKPVSCPLKVWVTNVLPSSFILSLQAPLWCSRASSSP
jgi:hypothetical protein